MRHRPRTKARTPKKWRPAFGCLLSSCSSRTEPKNRPRPKFEIFASPDRVSFGTLLRMELRLRSCTLVTGAICAQRRVAAARSRCFLTAFSCGEWCMAIVCQPTVTSVLAARRSARASAFELLEHKLAPNIAAWVSRFFSTRNSTADSNERNGAVVGASLGCCPPAHPGFCGPGVDLPFTGDSVTGPRMRLRPWLAL